MADQCVYDHRSYVESEERGNKGFPQLMAFLEQPEPAVRRGAVEQEEHGPRSAHPGEYDEAERLRDPGKAFVHTTPWHPEAQQRCQVLPGL